MTKVNDFLRSAIVGLAFLGAMASDTSAAALTFYVAPDGNDANPGTQAQPFATATRARDAIRMASGRTAANQSGVPQGWQGAEVIFRAGTYRFSEALSLDARDSGSSGARVILKAYPGETVVWSGGLPIPARSWKKVDDPVLKSRIKPAVRESVYMLDLRELGLKSLGGLGQSGSRIDLIVNGIRAPLSRWPNSSWSGIGSAASSLTGPGFVPTENRVKSWSPAENIWMHGYWTDDRSDDWRAVVGLNGSANRIDLASGSAGSAISAGQWFRAVNVLEELDQAGEWWVDPARAHVLWMPVNVPELAQTEFAVAPSALQVVGASWITVRDIRMQSTRSHTAEVAQAEGFRAESLTIRSAGGWGIRVVDGSGALLTGLDVSGTSQGGVYLSGGDRVTLGSSGHRLEASTIRDFGQVERGASAGVCLAGVGATVSGCVVEDGPQAGIVFSGNEHRIENTTIRRVCLETGSKGAITADGDWTTRGTVITGNTILDIRPTQRPNWASSIEQPAGIALKSGTSGAVIIANTFANAGSGIVVDGGRDNTINANTFTATTTPILVRSLRDTEGLETNLRAGLAAAAFVSNSFWTAKYPAMAALANAGAAAPENNTLVGNRVTDATALVYATAAARAAIDTSQVNLAANGSPTQLSSLLGYEDVAATPAPVESYSGLTFYVAPAGSDSNSGTAQSPFATIARARDAIRVETGRSSSGGNPPAWWAGARVIMSGGTYYQSSGLTLDSRDSGTEGKPVEYRAAGGASVIVTGAKPVADSAWQLLEKESDDSFAWARLPVASRGRVYRLNVGVLDVDKGTSNADGSASLNWMVPIINGEMRQMARWPDGEITASNGWVYLDSVVSDGGASAASKFRVAQSQPGQWDKSSQELFLYGHLAHDWAAHWSTVDQLGSEGGKSVITIRSHPDWDYPIGHDPQRILFFANMLQFLSREGMYVWNHQRGMLYYLPKAGEGRPANTSLTNSLFTIMNGPRWPGDPANTASWVTFDGLVIEGGRENIVQVQHGEGVVLQNCTVQNGGAASGVSFRFGRKHEVRNSTVRDVQGHGIAMRGVGDVSNYVDGECVIDNSVFERCGWFAHGSAEGVTLSFNWNTPSACGVTIRNNIFRNLPGGGLLFTAARILVENNEFRDVCQIAGDMGAAYAGGKLTHRGNVVRGNRFTNVVRHPLIGRSWGALTGVYIDDSFSGVRIEANTFENCDHGLFLASGKDLVVQDNIFIDCHSGHFGAAICMGSRVGWGQGKIDTDLAVTPVDREPWVSLFPDLSKMRPGGNLYDTRMRPSNNVIRNNLARTGSFLASVHPDIIGDHNGAELNFDINDARMETRKALSLLWRREY